MFPQSRQVKSVIAGTVFRDGEGWSLRFFFNPIEKFSSW
jgi:hypothetical protein